MRDLFHGDTLSRKNKPMLLTASALADTLIRFGILQIERHGTRAAVSMLVRGGGREDCASGILARIRFCVRGKVYVKILCLMIVRRLVIDVSQ
jgi:hypothetical protein